MIASQGVIQDDGGYGYGSSSARRTASRSSAPFALKIAVHRIRAALRLVLLLALLLLVGTACTAEVPQGTLEVVEILPHDSTSYTQGLVMSGADLFESAGQYGRSTLRRVDPGSGEIRAVDSLQADYFAEGLAAHDGRLVLLTWKEHVAFVYDPSTLGVVDTIPVDTFGWGLCSDGLNLYMTSGGSILYRRDARTFERLEDIQITRLGVPLWQVNELECVGDYVYGNVFQSTTIVQIDKATGRVVAEYDAASLVPPAHRGSPEAVLNGIAQDPASGTFLLTGKLWPVMYRVRLFEPA